MGKGAQILIGATAVALLLGWLAVAGVEEGAFRYYQTLGEFRTAGRVDQASRVHGYVSLGSIERDVAAKEIRFRVQGSAPHAGGSAADTLPVTFASLEAPDLFKDGAEVVVEGRLAADGRFLASNVLAKCPSKFEAAEREKANAPAG
ncbi:MAG TPA: cytochrome c maturation protein CcmE [Myxococcota bacterium]|jgi:cytochrome c-type biogenesis protein CcmE|nr:cytochrome c maturation protein CcmE [Myxococcota bacterium]